MTHDVDEYLERLPPDKRDALERIRTAVKTAAPDTEEVISYKMPGFKLYGQFFVSYDAFKNHFSLFPASDAVEKALGDLASRYVRGRGTLQFRYDDAPSPEVLESIVRARLAEVEASKP